MMGEYDAGYEHYIDSLIREIEKLQEESDRLRELCEDIRICARDNQCSLCYLASGKCEFADRMRELGIEVDDA